MAMNRKTLHLYGCLLLSLLVGIVYTSAQPIRPAGPFYLAWSPDGTKIAGAGDGYLRVWDATTSAIIFDFQVVPQTYVSDISWSPDSQRLVSASDDQFVRIWNIADPNYPVGQLLFEVQPITSNQGLLRSVDWRSDGQTIAIGSFYERLTLRLLNPTMQQITNEFRAGDVTMLRWSPIASEDEVALANGNDGAIVLPLTQFDQPSPAIGGREVASSVVAWNSDGSKIAVGYQDGTIYVWDTATNAEVVSMNTGSAGFIHALAWNFDDSLLASTNDDGAIQIWNSSTGQLIQQTSPNTSGAADFSPLNNRLVYSDPNANGNIQIINVATQITPSSSTSPSPTARPTAVR
jgi:WD40 repeat protein